MQLRRQLGRQTRDLLQRLGVRSLPSLLNGVPVQAPVELAPLVPQFLRPCDLASADERVFLTYCLKLLKQGDVVLDIGANVGLVSLMMAREVGATGTVHAFEPNARSAKLLSEFASCNRAANIKCVNKAVGAKEQTVRLTLNDLTSMVTMDPCYQGETSDVEMTTVDTYADSLQRNPHALKIDVEGYEMNVLDGARRTLDSVDLVFCEIHPRQLLKASGHEPADVVGLLARHGLVQDKVFYPLKHVLDPGRPYNAVFHRRGAPRLP